MGRDSWRYARHEEERAKKRRMNPVWRGVGCFMMVALMILAYFLSGWFIQQNAAEGWVYLPPELIAPPYMDFLPPGAALQAVVALFTLLFSYGLISLGYAILFPIELGETDVKPLKMSDLRRERRGKR
jgi:hypothetical protein